MIRCIGASAASPFPTPEIWPLGWYPREVDQATLQSCRKPSASGNWPDAIRVSVAAPAQEVTLRFIGLEYRALAAGRDVVRTGGASRLLTSRKWAVLKNWSTNENLPPFLGDRHQARLYRAQRNGGSNSWSLPHPSRIDARRTLSISIHRYRVLGRRSRHHRSAGSDARRTPRGGSN